MTPDELLAKLSKKFKVLKFIDLSLVSDNPSLGFAAFNEQYKEVFEPDERVVFYTGSCVGEKTLAYLQFSADLFDISRCFILVCCSKNNNPIVENDIEFIEVVVTSDPFDDHNMMSINSICALPWFHSEYMNFGEPQICCFNSETILGSTVSDFFVSEKMNLLRSQLLAGERPASCNNCWTIEDQGSTSLRQWRNKTHKKEFFTQYLDQPVLTSLALRPSTVCNFKCRSCGPENSSLWAQEELDHTNDVNKKYQLLELISNGQWFDTEKYKEIFELWPKLEFIDIYGGEPLLIKQFKQLLEHSIKSGVNQKQRLHFNTNGSIFPTDLIALMYKFKEVTISLSIDDINTRFEIIRGGTWADINHNVDKFLSCDPEIFKVSGLVTLTNLNLLYLDEILVWADNKKLPVTLNIALTPEYLRYYYITQSVKNLFIKKYQNNTDQRLKAIIETIKQTESVDNHEWVTKMTQLDLRRNQNMLDSHYELALNMGYKN
jgi:MoaA/NifB/PqqE/SkfB family radical SAM enzyme